jgi:hypothetical protein
MGCSPALFWVVTILLKPVLDVPPPDEYLPTDANIRNPPIRIRVMQQLKCLRLSESEPALEFAARQHVSFAGRPISFFVSAHAHLLYGFSSLPIVALS